MSVQEERCRIRQTFRAREALDLLPAGLFLRCLNQDGIQWGQNPDVRDSILVSTVGNRNPYI